MAESYKKSDIYWKLSISISIAISLEHFFTCYNVYCWNSFKTTIRVWYADIAFQSMAFLHINNCLISSLLPLINTSNTCFTISFLIVFFLLFCYFHSYSYSYSYSYRNWPVRKGWTISFLVNTMIKFIVHKTILQELDLYNSLMQKHFYFSIENLFSNNLTWILFLD